MYDYLLMSISAPVLHGLPHANATHVGGGLFWFVMWYEHNFGHNRVNVKHGMNTIEVLVFEAQLLGLRTNSVHDEH